MSLRFPFLIRDLIPLSEPCVERHRQKMLPERAARTLDSVYTTVPIVCVCKDWHWGLFPANPYNGNIIIKVQAGDFPATETLVLVYIHLKTYTHTLYKLDDAYSYSRNDRRSAFLVF